MLYREIDNRVHQDKMSTMSEVYVDNKVFDKINYSSKPLPKGEYDGCTFNACDFSNTYLSDILFTDCSFIGCNLSMVKLHKTSLVDLIFKDCKILGVHFEDCNPFSISFSFENCILNHSSFYKMKIQKTIFRNCKLQEVDFLETDLSSAIFDQSDLMNAHFEQTILEKADLRTATNYNIDPTINKLRNAMFSYPEVLSLLGKFQVKVSG